MGEWRSYSYTGDDGCKWCGKKLRQQCDSKFEYIDIEPKKCRSCGSTNIQWTSGIVGQRGACCCGDCGVYIDTRRRKMVSRKKRYPKPGDYGDGHFCGLRCGYQFGVAMGDAGRKFAPTKVQS